MILIEQLRDAVAAVSNMDTAGAKEITVNAIGLAELRAFLEMAKSGKGYGGESSFAGVPFRLVDNQAEPWRIIVVPL